MAELKKYFAKTDIGPFCILNEDDVEVDLINNLFLIFDGLGGSNIGNVAVQKSKQIIKKIYTKTTDDPDATMPHFYSTQYTIEANGLINSIISANDILYKENQQKVFHERGATSFIVGAVTDNLFVCVSAGNCRMILIRNGKILEKIRP